MESREKPYAGLAGMCEELAQKRAGQTERAAGEERRVAVLNYEETRNILTILKINYPQSFKGYTAETGQAFLNLWAEAFAHEPVELVIKAIKSIIYTDPREFAPNIAQVKLKVGEMVNGDTATPEEAWSMVITAARKAIPGDYENQKALWEALPPVARQLLDPADLATIGMKSVQDNDNYQRPTFLKQYREALRKQIASIAMSNSGVALPYEPKKIGDVTE